MKATLTEAAWAAAKTKNTYLRSKYYSLVGRRGKKKALIAVGHKILIACYYILRHKVSYDELGFDYLNKRKSSRIAHNYVRKLKELGYEVNIAPQAA